MVVAPGVGVVKHTVGTSRGLVGVISRLRYRRPVPAYCGRSPVGSLGAGLGTQAFGCDLFAFGPCSGKLILLLEFLKPDWIIKMAMTFRAAQGGGEFSSFFFDHLVIERLTLTEAFSSPIGQGPFDVREFALGPLNR